MSLGDVSRIQSRIRREDFYEYRPASDPEYLPTADDPTWARFVFRPDGSRRVLRRSASGDCTFLRPNGCELPLSIRPLACRLYPFVYNAHGLTGLEHSCPVDLLAEGQSLLHALAMPDLTEVTAWHRMLYAELPLEVEPTPAFRIAAAS